MNKNKFITKDLKKFIFLVLLAIILIISIIYLDYVFVYTLCDSTSSHDFVNDDTNRASNENGVSKISSLYNSFRCRVSWYVLDKGNGIYTSYNEFKRNWDTNTRLIDIIKADFKRSVAEARAMRKRNNTYDEQMSKIREARRVEEARKYIEKRVEQFKYTQNRK